MLRPIFQQHWLDEESRPAGGVSYGGGFAISWQNGPLKWPDGTQRAPNGAFVEDVLQAIIGRIQCYQSSEFACLENADALQHLIAAAQRLNDRTKDREARNVEGTHKL